MLRFMVSVPLALCLSLLLFYLLALITSVDDLRVPEQQFIPNLDFLLVRQESEIELRKRQLPPEPEELVQQQQPEIPQLQPQSALAVNADLPNIDLPDIDMGIQISLSPSLHNLSVPTPTMTMDTNPTVLSQFPPRYPQRALRRRQEGQVVVEFTITEMGTVKPGSVVVVESTPSGVFDKAVLRAIQRWRFKTRLVNGQPVPFKARQKLEFKLEK
ncbi:energy transducer TonB [Pontibacterium sp.]|uniref:energy transducer TonB n=1 Tax=Pontibacterium sp. TaxID=2036026 RepID=UPI003519C233